MEAAVQVSQVVCSGVMPKAKSALSTRLALGEVLEAPLFNTAVGKRHLKKAFAVLLKNQRFSVGAECLDELIAIHCNLLL